MFDQYDNPFEDWYQSSCGGPPQGFTPEEIERKVNKIVADLLRDGEHVELLGGPHDGMILIPMSALGIEIALGEDKSDIYHMRPDLSEYGRTIYTYAGKKD